MNTEQKLKNTVLVPVTLDACAVNEPMAENGLFRKWSFTYESLNYYASPKPEAMDRNSISTENGRTKTGIHLHWSLPRALRCMEENADTFPLVPNRWLIVRKASQDCLTRSWILESDCPESKVVSRLKRVKMKAYMSDFIVTQKMHNMWQDSSDEYRKNAVIKGLDKLSQVPTVSLGTAFPFEEWEERAEKAMFLTAYAPGNTAFAAYTAHNGNIFSFFDDLEYEDSQSGLKKKINEAEISYFIAGWYSDKKQDMTARLLNVQSEKAEGIYTGAVFAIPWNRREGNLDAGQLKSHQHGQNLMIAVGEQGVDAYQEMMALAVTGSSGYDKDFLKKLNAVQYGSLGDLHMADGNIRLANHIHQTTFIGSDGGSFWEIMAEKPGENETVAVSLTEKERKCLDVLNKKQYIYDRAIEELKSLQWEVHALWWKMGHREFVKVSDAVRRIDYEKELDGTKSDSMVSKLADQIKKTGILERELKEAVLQANPGEGRELRRLPSQRYYKKKNPVIALAGVEAAPDLDASMECHTRLLEECEFHSEVFKDTRKVLPYGLPNVINEFLYLENEREKRGIELAAPYSLKPWTPHWEPIFAEWAIQYQHVPFTTGKDGNWIFDGTRYHLNKNVKTSDLWTSYSGVSLLSSHLPDILKNKLETALKNLDEYESIEEKIRTIKETPVLSQELEHLDDFMAQRDSRAFRKPAEERVHFQGGMSQYLNDLLGYEPAGGRESDVPEYIYGHIDSVPYILNQTVSDFYGIRCGQAYFCDLRLYDKFGRCLDVIDSEKLSGTAQAKNYPILVSKNMGPEINMFPGIQSSFQIQPSILQNTRLYVTDKNIAGYVIVNHQNVSIMLYLKDGQQAGELALRVKDDGSRRVTYISSVHKDSYNQEKLVEDAPKLNLFAEGILAKTEEEFYSFIREIDSTLWTIDRFADREDENLSVLMGRPIALAGCRLELMTEGRPWKDNDWDAVAQDQSEFLCAAYPVRFGDITLRNDGMLGYYSDENLTDYKSIRHKDEQYDTLKINSAREMFFLMDPRRSVHMYTGILPVKTLSLESEQVSKALESIEASFFTGPVLTYVDLEERSIRLPKMAEQNGTFRWWRRLSSDTKVWKDYEILPYEKTAGFERVPPGLWEGTLNFQTNMNEEGGRKDVGGRKVDGAAEV